MTVATYRSEGVARFPAFAGSREIEALRGEFERLAALPGVLRRSGAVVGIRALFRHSPAIAAMARTGRWPALASRLLGTSARAVRAVRAVFFDKTPEANWPLPWHQDRTAALRWDHLPDGFRNPTDKDGQTRAELPVEWLRAMITLRLHLDPAGEETGALHIAPGLHLGPILDDASLRDLSRHARPVVVDAGDLIAMSPLTPRSSHRVRRACRRRVLHAEFCSKPLPDGVRWDEAA